VNALDNIIGYFSPKRGLARARARQAMRVYEGAATGRRTTAWRGRGSSANSEISKALGPLRDRARELVRNTPHASRLVDVLVTSIIGEGIRPVPNTGSDRINDRVEQLWNEWQAQADVEGIESFYGMQVIATRALIESGETILRFIDRDPKDVDGPIPLRLQLLEADHIDSGRDGIMSGGDGPRSRLGVGLGDYDYRMGLWLFPQHPGEEMIAKAKSFSSVFVKSDQLIHLFGRTRPGQVRGVSWFAPMLTTAREFADFMDAVNVKARVEACFSAFVTQVDELESIFSEVPTDQTGAPEPVTMMEPGTIKQLKPGQDIKFAQATSTSQVESIMMFSLMAMAASLNVTYDQVSGDLRHANYSSLRAGKMDFRAHIQQLQTLIIIPRLCDRVWKRFIDRAILAGEVTPAWESINPKFDEDAQERSVRAGRMTPQEYYASWGSNWRKQLRDIQEFYKYADELGVALDIDVRNYTRVGQKQPPDQKQAGASGGAPGAPANGAANGQANPAATVMLVDANGEPIDLADLTSPD
jgi:lambda family phage portal protein